MPKSAIDCCASLSQLGAVAEAALTEAIAMDVDRPSFTGRYATGVNESWNR